MNVHDQAHRLARELVASKEYRNLIEVQKRLKQDEQCKEMLKDFQKKQFELQAAQLSGQDVKDKEEKLQQLYSVLSANSLAREVLEAEYSFNKLYTDIQKIINDAIAESLDME